MAICHEIRARELAAAISISSRIGRRYRYYPCFWARLADLEVRNIGGMALGKFFSYRESRMVLLRTIPL